MVKAVSDLAQYNQREIGHVVRHSSGPDEGPDVGLSLALSASEELWAGEVSNDLFESCNGREAFGSDGGWFLVQYGSDKNERRLIAKFTDQSEAQDFMDRIAAWVRDAK